MPDAYDLEPWEEDEDEPELDLDLEAEGKQAKGPGQGNSPEVPLPRLWKEQEEEPLEPEVDKKSKEPRKDSEPPRSRKPAKTVSKKPHDEAKDRKGVVEETPAIDTYESRQRIRMILGSLLVASAIFFFWVVSRLIFQPSSPPTPVAQEDSSGAMFGTQPPPRVDLETEARDMYNRASEQSKRKQNEEAKVLLDQVVKAYPATRAAREAREALGRFEQNLPMFPDRPIVEAEVPRPTPQPKAPPPPATTLVVNNGPESNTTPTKANATIVLPVNPAEAPPPPSSTLAMAASPGAPLPRRVLPKGFQARSGSGFHPSGWPLVIVGARDGANMMLIPGGTFTMGNDGGQAQEAPAHRVRLSTYYIDEHEVSVGQFRRFLSETRYPGQPPKTLMPEASVSDRLAMVNVNLRDAEAFAAWAQKVLPTEAQWEMAARSTDGRLYPWGPEPLAIPRSQGPRQAAPIMTSPDDRSPFGVFDLGGNVLEWTADWYSSRYHRALAGRVVDDPTGGPKTAKLEVTVKGGSRTGSAAYREPIGHDRRINYIGFRCALPVEGSLAGVTPPPASRPAPPVPPQGEAPPPF